MAFLGHSDAEGANRFGEWYSKKLRDQTNAAGKADRGEPKSQIERQFDSSFAMGALPAAGALNRSNDYSGGASHSYKRPTRKPLRKRIPQAARIKARPPPMQGAQGIRAQIDSLAPAGRRAGDASRSVQAIPHQAANGSPADVAFARCIALREVNRTNFLINHGIKITAADDVDLEHTSCEEEEGELEESERCSQRHIDSMLETRKSTASISSLPAQTSQRVSSSLSTSRTKSASMHSLPAAYDEASAVYNSAQYDDDEDEDDAIDGRLEDDYPDSAESDSDSLVHGGQSAASRSLRARPVAPNYRDTASKSVGRSRASIGGHGSHTRMNSCFLCRWGNQKYDSVSNDQMNTLLQLIYENIGQVDTPFIALAVHAYYKNVIRPSAAGAGQFLPPFRSKAVYICIETHNFDPRIRLAGDIRALSIIQAAYERKIFSRNVVDLDLGGGEGNDIVDPKQTKAYLDVMKMKWGLYNNKTSSNNYMREGADIKLGSDRQFFRGVKLRNSEKQRQVSAIGKY